MLNLLQTGEILTCVPCLLTLGVGRVMLTSTQDSAGSCTCLVNSSCNWLGHCDRSPKSRECVLVVFHSSTHTGVILAGFNCAFSGDNFIDI